MYLEEFSVGANIALAIELQGKKATDEEINRILKQVDLEALVTENLTNFQVVRNRELQLQEHL